MILVAVLGLYRPPQPPSSPSSSAKLTQATPSGWEAAKPAPHLDYKYVWHQGFIGAGGDVEPPANSTVDQALKHCDALARCRGITYSGGKNASGELKIYFKMSDGVSGTAGWSAWIKRAQVTPPAVTLAVGGSSRLELRLRQDYFTIQNLSRAGDLWSFSRPLDDSSALPMCAHVGDMTVRLKTPGGAPESGGEWAFFTTITLGAAATPVPADAARAVAAKASNQPASDGGEVLAAHNLTNLLAASEPNMAFPISVVRRRSFAKHTPQHPSASLCHAFAWTGG
jgi:hypothetical protein